MRVVAVSYEKYVVSRVSRMTDTFTPEEIHEMSMLHDRDCGTVEATFGGWSLQPVIRVKVDECTCRRRHYIASPGRAKPLPHHQD